MQGFFRTKNPGSCVLALEVAVQQTVRSYSMAVAVLAAAEIVGLELVAEAPGAAVGTAAELEPRERLAGEPAGFAAELQTL